jgi:hypothetical protein
MKPSFRPWLRLGWPVLVGVAVLLAGGHAPAQAPGRELLNSERIAQKFGNYAVEVVATDGRTRVSNLYTVEGGTKTCRTYAIVRFPPTIDAAVAAEHAKIVSGGSIGAVFAASGWRVLKTHLYYGEVAATPRVASLMHVAVGTALAEHAYVLDVAKNDEKIEYAALVEIHHPEYLERAELERVYGAPDASGRRDLLRALLAAAARAMQ